MLRGRGGSAGLVSTDEAEGQIWMELYSVFTALTREAHIVEWNIDP
jgi:hypothetical protein